MCNASFKCKYKSIYIMCRITEIALVLFHSLYMHMYFATKEWKWYTKLTQLLLSLLFIHTHSPTCFQFTDEKGRKRGNKDSGLPYHFLYFCVIIFSLSDWLTHGRNMSKRRI